MIRFYFLVGTFISSICPTNLPAQQPMVQESMGNCITIQSKQLLGSSYKSGTLENNTEEILTYSTNAFDCVTLVEYVLTKTLIECTQKFKSYSFDSLLTAMRYRNGKILGYGSRLHYFSEWILQNENFGILSNITHTFPSLEYEKTINYMSSNIKKYPKLKDSLDISQVKISEQKINQKKWYYLPKNTVKTMENQLKNGDIIAITTSTVGLDISHVGFIVKENGKTKLLHTSESYGKVIISRETLSQYLNKNKKQTGIMVLRVK